jgi:hypothetical protein
MYRKAYKRRAVGRRKSAFLPKEPEIVAEKFVGRRLSDLSNEELADFLSWDARFQNRTVSMPLFTTWGTPVFRKNLVLHISECIIQKFGSSRRVNAVQNSIAPHPGRWRRAIVS